MGLHLKITGGTVNIDLTGDEITLYEFNMDAPNSKYAKSMMECYMKLEGDIMYMTTHSPEALAQIRKWSEYEYAGERDKYYHFAELKYIYKDTLIRTTTFPDAYVTEYEEILNVHSGEGKFILTLKQKRDRMEWIAFDGESYGNVIRERKLKKQQELQLQAQPMPANLLFTNVATSSLFANSTSLRFFNSGDFPIWPTLRVLLSLVKVAYVLPKGLCGILSNNQGMFGKQLINHFQRVCVK